jgi:hypothetical protein
MAQPITAQCFRGSDAVASASPPMNLRADTPITVATATTPSRRMIFVFKLVSLGSLSAAQSGPAATEAARLFGRARLPALLLPITRSA